MLGRRKGGRAAAQLEAAVAKVSEAHGVDGKIEAAASIAETAAPLVSAVVGAVEDACATPIPAGSPMGKIWDHLSHIEQVASEIFGSGNGDNAAVMGALQGFKDALNAHPVSAA